MSERNLPVFLKAAMDDRRPTAGEMLNSSPNLQLCFVSHEKHGPRMHQDVREALGRFEDYASAPIT